LGPRGLRQRRRARDVFDQTSRQAHISIVLPPQLTDVDASRGVGIGDHVGVLYLVQQLAQSRIGPAVVHQAGDERQLLAPVLHTPRWHVGLFVPLEERLAGEKQAFLPYSSNQLGIRGVGVHIFPGYRSRASRFGIAARRGRRNINSPSACI
jgi:hypothetical protein